MFQLSIKIAAVFSTAIAGFGLAAVGFVANTEPTQGVIHGIRVIAMGLPAGLLILGAVLLIFYDLSPKKWRESIKIPDLDAIDWEGSGKEMEPFYHPDKMSSFWVLNDPFERLHSIIGIEEAFMAFYDEPEAVHEFMEFITEFKIKLLGKMIDHYKIDIILFHDDWGSGQSGFFSEAVYKEFIYPYMKRIVQYVKSRNVYFDMHSDGKVQMYMPFIVDMGCDMWNPAQCCNDLEMIKEKYGDKLVISGGMDGYYLDSPKITEEELRSYVRKKLDTLAKGGGYLPKPNAKSLKSSAIMADELAKYSLHFYDKLSHRQIGCALWDIDP